MSNREQILIKTDKIQHNGDIILFIYNDYLLNHFDNGSNIKTLEEMFFDLYTKFSFLFRFRIQESRVKIVYILGLDS